MYQTTVRYGEMRYLGVFRTEIDSIRRGDSVIIRSGRGVEVGLALTPSAPAVNTPEEPAGDVMRKAGDADAQQIRLLDELGKTKAFRYVKEKIAEHHLPMKLSYVEHLFGGDKVIVYFRSEGRVDFRGLVRDLSAHFQTRIVMKQIGARDEARLLGDWNDCGRELCCRTHLQNLVPIPMKMAKSQKTTLDPAKISGRCGRLKCCLRYEHDTYVEFKKRLPRPGARVRSRDGIGVVVGTDVLSQIVTVELPSGARSNYKAGEVLPLEKGTQSRGRREQKRESFYVTVPFFNIETPITIQAVYCGLAADALARFHAASGRTVHFLTGVKDHSRATQRAATEESSLLSRGDRYQAQLADEWARLSISSSQIFRTEAEIHKKTVRDFFKKLRTNDDIYKTLFQGSHCVTCHWSAPGDRSGRDTCLYCGGPVETVDEELYLFRLSKFQKKVLGHLKTHENFIKPKILKIDVEDRLKESTGDVIVARPSFDYGIAIPDDEDQIVSGWFESLLAYVSALADGKKNPMFETFWPADVHLVTREHLWTHAVIWPSMLFAGEIPLPHQIVVGGDWTDADGSPGRPETVLASDVVERFGGASLRYYLLHETPFGLSGTFRMDDFSRIVHRNLSSELVQLVGRILSLAEKYHDSRVPSPGDHREPPEEIRAIVERLEREYVVNLETLQFSIALSTIWEALRGLAVHLDATKPWKLARKGEPSPELAAAVYDLLETLRIVAIHLFPLLPRTAERLLQKLGVEPAIGLAAEQTRWGGLPPGAVVDRKAPLFLKLESEGDAVPAPPAAVPADDTPSNPEDEPR